MSREKKLSLEDKLNMHFAELGVAEGDTYKAAIYHLADCEIFDTGRCTCDPVIDMVRKIEGADETP